MKLEKLLERLREGDREVRDRLRAMGAEAADAAPALAEAVATGDPEHRKSAMFVLEGMGAAARPAVPALLDALRDEDMDISAQAADTLGALGAEAVPGLVTTLNDADWRVRQAACLALGIAGPDAREAVPALLQKAQSDREEVRQRAVWSLGEIGDTSALDTLVEIFTEEGGSIGVWIAEAFGRWGRRARPAANALRAELHRGDAMLAISAAEALRRIEEHEDAAIWALIAWIQSDETEYRQEAAITLGDFGPKGRAALPALQATARDADEELRAQALMAIAKIRPELAEPVAASAAEPAGDSPA